jgi:pimeloyl-ACP methyl ester carboxylesterase
MVNGGLVDLKEVPAKEAASLYGPPTLDGVTLDAFREELVAEAPQGLISPAIEAALLASYTIDEEEILTPRLSRNGWMKLLREMASHPPAGFYSRIACPVLILAARHAEGNSMATTEAVARAEASIEDVETIWLEEATHNAPLQNPHRVAEAIRAFLRQHM